MSDTAIKLMTCGLVSNGPSLWIVRAAFTLIFHWRKSDTNKPFLPIPVKTQHRLLNQFLTEVLIQRCTLKGLDQEVYQNIWTKWTVLGINKRASTDLSFFYKSEFIFFKSSIFVEKLSNFIGLPKYFTRSCFDPDPLWLFLTLNGYYRVFLHFEP